uniref:Uncharacterized protein n=1 Tax=Arundo donax TaxID=35708 RepID=A0A0A9H006_ARUDO
MSHLCFSLLFRLGYVASDILFCGPFASLILCQCFSCSIRIFAWFLNFDWFSRWETVSSFEIQFFGSVTHSFGFLSAVLKLRILPSNV